MKLLASDYDGTLKFGDSVLEEDIEAIKKWRDEGNLFAIVTGRSKESITQQCQEYGIPVDYFVTNNGGMVFDDTGEVLMRSQLDTVTAVDLMYIAHEIPQVASYMVNDGINRHKVEVHPHVEEHRYPHIRPDWSEEQIMDSGQFAQIVLSMSDPDSALFTADKINQYFGSQVTAYPNQFVVDIVPKGISKATGLEFVREYRDVDDEDVYAIGDSHNDIPMLASCLNSGAMALAAEEVKENAKGEYVTLSEFVDTID